MWARVQHDRWNEEASNAKKAAGKVTNGDDDKKQEDCMADMKTQAQLWMMQKVVSSSHVTNVMQEEFVRSVCQNTELNQFE